MDSEKNSPKDEPLASDQQAFEIPAGFRWLASILAIALIVLPLMAVWLYSVDQRRFVSPAELGVVQLVLAGTLLLLIVLAPWKALGLRIRKVGIFEFERVVRTQATEHAQEFTELRARIDELDTRIRGVDDVAQISEHFEDVQLAPLLRKFLNQFAPQAFSPLRIRDWGARQPGYEALANARLASIRRILQRFVSEGHAVTRVSRLGNTLYKVPDRS